MVCVCKLIEKKCKKKKKEIGEKQDGTKDSSIYFFLQEG